MTLQGASRRESGLTPAPLILDSRQQQLTARVENRCSSMLKELHHKPCSSAPICNIVTEGHEHGRITESTDWLPPMRRIRGEDHHTGRHHCSQERRATLGKRERSQSQSRGLDVVDRQIALRRWPSGSRSGVHTRESMEVSPQLSGHWTYGRLRRQTVSDRTRA